MTVKLNKNACDKKPSCKMVALCPTGAISIRESEYPEIDQEVCVECGQCIIECPHQALYIA